MRRRLERVVPDLLRKVLDAGAGRLGDRPEALRQILGELRLPKDALTLLTAHLEETKNGVYGTVAREVREFLERSNLADELTRALTKLSFEIRTEIRFIPNEAAGSRPSIRARTRIKRQEERLHAEADTSAPSPEPDDVQPPCGGDESRTPTIKE